MLEWGFCYRPSRSSRSSLYFNSRVQTNIYLVTYFQWQSDAFLFAQSWSLEGNCTAGYHCEEGSDSPNPNVCPLGFYCPSGTPTPLTCEDGYHSNRTGSLSSTLLEVKIYQKWCSYRRALLYLQGRTIREKFPYGSHWNHAIEWMGNHGTDGQRCVVMHWLIR